MEFKRTEKVIEYCEGSFDTITINLNKSINGKRIVARKLVNSNIWKVRVIRGDGRTVNFKELYINENVKNENLEDLLIELQNKF